jgi:hypothetical protein
MRTNSLLRKEGYVRLSIARAISRPTVTIAATDWVPIVILGLRMSGIVSVGL